MVSQLLFLLINYSNKSLMSSPALLFNLCWFFWRRVNLSNTLVVAFEGVPIKLLGARLKPRRFAQGAPPADLPPRPAFLELGYQVLIEAQ